MTNLLANLPDSLNEEQFEDIVKGKDVRIERILSHGQSSPESGWYDQDESEWVMVLSGFGVIEFEDGRIVKLEQGDHVSIPAHCKHKVKQTAQDEITVWLAVFYKG
ncbi:cupin domain-containing protein [Vibrio europaeus]|uniref:cupin domain-containing protein n=1 Tax=Vibrio europaeus TaxID=300876 RepID=UPI00233F3796|nr:cupin domain-containing protein [Vibrio europaeus]MDC5805422.1 cupin domain-containing protein [Vibrio europaeus]MDC5826503.1 cupin domain-containing protein [Vibrio europaeus]MDC5831869.1 cupin domain-containing protein [Vibrio europaeus]MDC5834824.1 cupin domain-containing protein [Vibrio europaeus]